MKIRYLLLALVLGVVVSATTGWVVRASDHDDGEIDQKGRSLNLTDLYAFREDWHTTTSTDEGNLILIMNTNPRSLPKTQYYFSPNARYEFHIKRVADKTVVYSSGEDATIRFIFSEPDSNKIQHMTITAIRDGVSSSTSTNSAGGTLDTTPITATSDTTNTLKFGDHTLSIFAGMKEDPFFFDVEAFFKVRAGIAATSTVSVNFAADAAHAKDFTAGYNINAIVARIPIAFLQSATTDTVFDVWETISVQQ